MNLYCPSCQSAFPGTDVCPRCGVRLLTPAEAFTLMPDRRTPPPDSIRATLVTRVVVGLTVAGGLYMGVHEWATAVGAPTEAAPDSPAGVWVAFGMQCLAVVVGGVLAGAGRPLGLFTGLVVGAAVGGLSLVPAATGDGVDSQLAGLAGGLAVLGAVAGFVGACVWPPAAEVVDNTTRGTGSSLAHLAQQEDRAKIKRQTDWLRVAIAVGVALVGLVGSGGIRATIRSTFGNAVVMGGPGASPAVDLQVAAVFFLAAGVFVGANTRSGPRHGLILGAAVGLFSIAMSLVRLPSAVVGLLKLFDMPPDLANPNALLAVMVSFLVVGGFTGWFGANLLPPLAPAWMLKRRLVD